MQGEPVSERLYWVVGQRIAERRTALRLTQGALASRVGLARTTITNLERGKQKVPLDHLHAIAVVLEVDLGDLIPTRAELAKKQTVPVVIGNIQTNVSPGAATAIAKYLRDAEGGIDVDEDRGSRAARGQSAEGESRDHPTGRRAGDRQGPRRASSQ